MKIIIILFYAFINTSNFYRSIFGYNNYIKTKYIWFIFNYFKNLFFTPDSKYIKATNELDENNNCFIYINGIMTPEDIAKKDKIHLEKLINKPVNILFNRSQSLLFDLYESFIGREKIKLTEASTKALHIITNKLIDPEINKIVIIAYSQGTVIISNVLQHLTIVGLDGEKYLQKLEIYCFSNCSSKTVYLKNQLPFMEHFANKEDFIAKLGCNCPKKIQKYINIDGDIHINETGWGHMLSKDYLNNFKNNFPNAHFNKYLLT